MTNIKREKMNGAIMRVALVVLTLCLWQCRGTAPREHPSSLPPEAFLQAVEEDTAAVLLDVRTPEEYAAGHLEGATLLDWKNQRAFRRGACRLDASRTLYIYCQGGVRSKEAADYLTKRGFRVVELKGGYKAVKR